MSDPTVTLADISDALREWTKQSEAVREQLAAAVAEQSKLTAERDIAKAEAARWKATSAQETEGVRVWHDRAGLLQRQWDKTLADLREAENQQLRLRQWLEGQKQAREKSQVPWRIAMVCLGTIAEIIEPSIDIEPPPDGSDASISQSNSTIADHHRGTHDEALTRPLEEQIAAKDRRIAELAAAVDSSLKEAHLVREAVIAGRSFMDRLGLWLTSDPRGDRSAILSTYLRSEASPLVKALEAMTAHASLFNRDTDSVWLAVKAQADAALRTWRASHPEPPEERGDAREPDRPPV